MGSYTWLKGRIDIARNAASQQLKKVIPEEDRILWKFSKADSGTKLLWEHSREFEYNGEMYDVIRSETKGDTIWYWCYLDRKETKLKKELNILIANLMAPGTQDRNQSFQLRDFFKSLFTPVITSLASLAIRYPDINHLKPYLFSLSSYDLIPPAPPPDLS